MGPEALALLGVGDGSLGAQRGGRWNAQRSASGKIGDMHLFPPWPLPVFVQ